MPERIQPTRQDIATLRENTLKAEIENDLKLAEVLWTRLVIHDSDEALKSLRRIWKKLEQLIKDDIKPGLTELTKSHTPRPQILTETLSGNIKLEMVKIPTGSFLMGSPDNDESAYDDEKPQHQVNLQEFYLGKYPVTQEQYQAIMGNNPSKFKNNPKNPVKTVTWNNAQEFCQKLSQSTGKKYRLPSEAEWEYACRAGTQTRYYFGDNGELLGE